jgi:Kef-type K+ transport system membrane component KefB
MGPHALEIRTNPATIEFLYELGFIVLMFLAGMEIDFNSLRQRGWQALLSMLFLCIAIFGLAFAGALLFSLHPIYGLAISAISVGLPLAVLRESRALHSPLGQVILLVASMGEVITVIGMTLFYFIVKHGFSTELFWGLGKLAAVLLTAALVLRTLMAAAYWRPKRFSKLVDPHDGTEIGVRAALLLAIAFSSLATTAGVESIVGAFLAGALISFVFRGKQILEEKLGAVGHGLFVPIFFIIVGVHFDPSQITWQTLGLAALLLVAMFSIRLFPSFWLMRQGLSVHEVIKTSCLLSAPLTLVVAISAIGVNLGVLSRKGHGTLILLALASGVVFPVLFRLTGKDPMKKTKK